MDSIDGLFGPLLITGQDLGLQGGSRAALQAEQVTHPRPPQANHISSSRERQTFLAIAGTTMSAATIPTAITTRVETTSIETGTCM